MDLWLWLPLGFMAALGTAAADVVTKRSFADLSPYSMSPKSAEKIYFEAS
jgi:hypothetical protein